MSGRQKSLSQVMKEFCAECGHHYDKHEFKEQTDSACYELLNDISKMTTLELGRIHKTLEFGNIPYKCLKDGCTCEKFVTPEWDTTNKEI